MVTSPAQGRSWLTESVLLASIPVMAYLLAFGYEYGYYLAYGFPQELITIDLNRVFAAGVLLLVVVFFVLIVMAVIFALLPSAHPLTPAVAQAVTLTLAYLVFLIYYEHSDLLAWIPGLLLVWYLLYKFLVPVLAQGGIAGYVRKYSAHEKVRQARMTLLSTTMRAFGSAPGMILVYFFAAVILSVTLGWNLATHRQCYMVIPEPPDRVVLRIYGDSIVLARLNRRAHQIQREYTVLRRTAGSVELREDCLGPLTVAP